MNIKAIIKDIDKNLEHIARSVLANKIEVETNHLLNIRNRDFFNCIDSPFQHQQRWHQWGIITHSRNFLDAYNNKLPIVFKNWNISIIIDKYLSTKIDGIAKKDLLQVSILFHDIGKFHKTYIINKKREVSFCFANHEKYSYDIIMNELYPLLKTHYRFTTNQIEYIAKSARFHLELGIIRKSASNNNLKYNIDFAKSQIFRDSVLKRLPTFENYKIEVGILFLADSYGKTNIEFDNKSDEEILSEIEAESANPKIISTIKQQPTNIAITKEYFKIINL